jgi:hypothetical protein
MTEQLTIPPVDHESVISDPEPPELLIGHMNLYHGSGTPGIAALNAAGEDTVGRGVYLVDNPSDAAGYAQLRAERRKLQPVVYQVEINNLKLANLNNPQKLEEVMQGFSRVLREKKESLPADSPWYRSAHIDRALLAIHGGIQVGHVKKATMGYGTLFSAYLESLSYDGLKTREGGEAGVVGSHDTYLIFDPANLQFNSEQPVIPAVATP